MMTHEWKPGDRPMVKIISINSAGYVRLEGAENTYLPLRILHPLPPALTPEDAAVLNRADDWSIDPDDWKVARDLKVAIQRRVAARQSPPVPADSAGQPESAADMLHRLGDDAAKWAAEFCKTAARLGHPGIDEGWMIGWFANAIEHSHAVRRWAKEKSAPSAATEVPPAAPAFKVGDRVRRKSDGRIGKIIEPGRPDLSEWWVYWTNGGVGIVPGNMLDLDPEQTATPDLSALRDAVVDSVKAWKQCKDSARTWHDADCTNMALNDVERNAAALLAAEAPRDPVEELREAAQAMHDDIAEYQRINKIGGYDNHCMRRLRAALAAMKDAQ